MSDEICEHCGKSIVECNKEKDDIWEHNNQEPTKEPMYVYRKIVAWRYWGTNYGHGYAAVLSCGHERMDLNDTRIGRPREALCWYCKPEEQ